MKISLFAYFTELVNKIGIESAVERIRECGYDGAEFFYTEGNIPDVEIGNKYRTVLKNYKIAVPCVSCYASVVKNNSPVIPDKSSIEALKRLADFTSALGAKYLHHTVYPCMDKICALTYDKIIEAAVEGCTEIAEYARNLGLTVLYEPQGLVFNGKDGFTNFYRKIKNTCDNVAVCFDVGNSYWIGEDPLHILDRIKSDVVHVHLKDYAALPATGSAAEPCEVTMGNGSVNMRKIISTLREIGYDGFFSIEDATDIPIEEKLARAKKIIK